MKSLQIKQLSESATLPTRSHSTDAGLDLYASERMRVNGYISSKVPTGIAINIPPGYEGQIRPRSGKTANTSLRVQLGTVDSGYTGELHVICDCQRHDLEYVIQKGEKIAQLVIQKVESPQLEIVDQFKTQSARGENGFGSTGE